MKRYIFILFIFCSLLAKSQSFVEGDSLEIYGGGKFTNVVSGVEALQDEQFPILRQLNDSIAKYAFKGFDNVIIVNQSNPLADTTITQAMASITDAAINNTYAIWLMGGDYTVANGETFPIVMKDYVSIIGFDDDLVRISGSASSLFTLASEKSSIRDVAITHTPSSSGYTFTASNTSSTAETKIQMCDLNYVSTTAGVTGGFIDISSDGILIIQDCFLMWSNTGGGSMANTGLMEYSGDLQVFFDTNILTATTNQSSGDLYIFNNSSTNVTTLSNSDLTATLTNALWSDNVMGWKVNTSNSVTKFSLNTITRFNGAGNGAAYGAYSNTGGTSVIDLNTISFKFNNFATEYFAWAGSAGDEINGIFANGEADNPTGTGIGGSGIVRKTVIENNNFVTNQAFIDENMRLDENTTNQSINDLLNGFFSAGWWSGGAVTDNGNGTIDVASGTGLIRVANDEQAAVKMFDWSDSLGIILTDGVATYVGVDYNAGIPIVITSLSGTDFRNNENNKFELYEIVREGTILHITDHKQRSKNTISLMQQLFYDIAKIRRTDGLIIDETGTRNITVTSGVIWVKLNKIITQAINTSTSGTFDRYYRDGVGGWTKTTGQTQWDNANYDDGSGTLAAIGANRYSYQDFYMDADGGLVSLYGQADYTSLALAEAAPLSATLPVRVDEHSLFIGRIAFQEGAATGTILSPFTGADFTVSPVSNHNDLSGINGTAPYNHLSDLELDAVQSINNMTTDRAIPVNDEPNNILIESTAKIDASGNMTVNGNSTITGKYYLDGTYTGAFVSEVNGEIVDFGTNYVQSGIFNPAHAGSFFRIDTRGSSLPSDMFTIFYQATPGSGESTVFKIGNTGNGNFTGTVTHVAPILNSHSALLDNIVGGINIGSFTSIQSSGNSSADIYTMPEQSLSGTTPTLDVTSGAIATITLTGNTTVTITNLPLGSQEGRIEIDQDATTPYTLTVAGSTGYTTTKLMGPKSQVNQILSSHTTLIYWRTGSILYYGFIYEN